MSEPNQSLLNTRPTAWSGVRPLLLTKKNASDTSLSRNTHTKATSLAENTHIDHLPKRGDRAATADPRSNVEGDTELDSVVLYVDDEASAKEACVLIEEASILAYDAEYVVIRSTPAVTPATAAGVGGNGVVEAMTTGKARDGDDTRDKAMHTRVNATDGTDTPETTAANMVASKVTYIASSNADGVSNRRHVIGDAAAAGVALSTGGCTDTCDNCPSSKPATLQIAAWNGAHARMHLVVIDMLTYSLAIEDGHANTLTVQTDADGECESGIDDRRLNNSALSEDALAADEAVAVEHNKAYGTVCAHDTDKTRQTTNPRSRGGGAGSEASGERRGSITHGGETVQRLAAVLRRKHMDTSVLKLGFSFGQDHRVLYHGSGHGRANAFDELRNFVDVQKLYTELHTRSPEERTRTPDPHTHATDTPTHTPDTPETHTPDTPDTDTEHAGKAHLGEHQTTDTWEEVNSSMHKEVVDIKRDEPSSTQRRTYRTQSTDEVISNTTKQENTSHTSIMTKQENTTSNTCNTTKHENTKSNERDEPSNTQQRTCGTPPTETAQTTIKPMTRKERKLEKKRQKELKKKRQKLKNIRIDTMGSNGLQACVDVMLGLYMSKENQCSDWSTRPLRTEQLRYAAMDSALLIPLYFALCADAATLSEGSQIDFWGKARDESGEAQENTGSHTHRHAHLLTPHSSAYRDIPSVPTWLRQHVHVDELKIEHADAKYIRKAEQQQKMADSLARAGSKYNQGQESATRGKSNATDKPPKGGTWTDIQFKLRVLQDMRIKHLPQIDWCDVSGNPKFVCDDQSEGLARQLRSLGLDCAFVRDHMPQGVCSNHGDGPNSEARGGNVDDEKTGDADRGSVESSNEIKKEDRGVSNSCSRSGRCPDSQRDQTICGSQLGMGCADTDKQSSTGTEHVPEDSKHKHVTGEIGSVCTNGSHTASTNESGSANATDSVDVKCTADDTRGTQRKRNKMTNSQKNIKQLTTWHMLIKIAEDENRIILTKNRRLAQAHANVSAKKGFNTPDTMKYQAAYFVSASDKYGQRREIVERFGLNIRERLLLTRCLTCNGTFDGPYSGHELDVSSVPTPEVLTVEGRVFYKCIGSCGAATWQGGQFTNHIAKLRLEYGDPNNVLPVEQDF